MRQQQQRAPVSAPPRGTWAGARARKAWNDRTLVSAAFVTSSFSSRRRRRRQYYGQTEPLCLSLLRRIDCPHWEACAGCTLQDATAQARPPIFEQVATFFAETFGYQLPEPVVASSSHHWRTLAKLAVRRAPKTPHHNVVDKVRSWAPQLGLFRAGTHEVVAIPECQVHHAALNKAFKCLECVLARSAVAIYDERRPRLESLRYVQLAVERRTGRVQLVLVGYREPTSQPVAPSRRRTDASLLTPTWRMLCDQLWEEGKRFGSKQQLWHSIWVHMHAGRGNAIFASAHEASQTETAQWQQVYGDAPFIIDEPLAGEPGPVMVLPPFAFQQANLTAYRAMLPLIGFWCMQPLPSSVQRRCNAAAMTSQPQVGTVASRSMPVLRIAEFCAGVGSIGLSVVRQMQQLPNAPAHIYLWASDIHPGGQVAFWETARRNGLLDERVRSALELRYQVGSMTALAQRVHDPKVAASIVIADPPRAGLGPVFISEVLGKALTPSATDDAASSRLERFIYVSCSMSSFMRDVRQLVSFAPNDRNRDASEPTVCWTLRHAQPYLFFPGADHLEMVAVFDRQVRGRCRMS